MKNHRLIFLFSLFTLLLSGFSVEAVNISINNPLKANNFQELIIDIANIIFNLSLAIAPIMLIVAGFYFVTAAANPENIVTARKIIIYTLIGLLVVIMSLGIINVFREIFVE